MSGLDKLADVLNDIRSDLKALNDKPMAIDRYVGCIYCGEPKGDRLSCCGENHFEEIDENDD